MSSSDYSVDQDNARKDGMLKSGSNAKKVGRPVGTAHNPYTVGEIRAAFDSLVEQCPRNVSGTDFLKMMQQKLKKVSGKERTLSGLQTFVKMRLRQWIPEMYKRRFEGPGKEPATPAQKFFLREYMKGTPWKMVENVYEKKGRSGEEKTQKKEDGEAGPSNAVKGEHKIVPKKITEYQNFFPTVASTPRAPGRVPVDKKADKNAALRSFIRDVVSEVLSDFQNQTLQKVKRIIDERQAKRRADSIEGPRLKKMKVKFQSDDKTDTEEDDLDAESDEMAEVITIGDSSGEECFEEEVAENMKVESVNEEDRVEENAVETEDHTALREVGVENDEQDNQKEKEDEACGSVDHTALREVGVENDEQDKQKKKKNDECGSVHHTALREVESTSSLIGQDKRSDDESSIRKMLEDSSVEDQLIIMASNTEARERAASFLMSPLRGRLSNVTVLTIVDTSKKGKTSEDYAFHVVEEKNGDLIMSHKSTLDQGEWSSEAVVDRHEVTLEDELQSVARGDILESFKNGPALSPMTVSSVGKKKKSFDMAKINSKGRVVKTLFKRKVD